MTPEDEGVSACENCHRGLPFGSRRRYCDRVCRQTAYRRRLGMKPRGRWHPRHEAMAVLRAIIEDEGASLSAMGYNVELVRDWLKEPAPSVEGESQ